MFLFKFIIEFPFESAYWYIVNHFLPGLYSGGDAARLSFGYIYLIINHDMVIRVDELIGDVL